MSSMNQRYKRDIGYDYESRRDDRRRRSRSRSRSRSHRYNRDRSRNRSRSRSLEYRRRHVRRSRSRSRSRSYSRRDRYTSSRRHRDSRTISRSRSRSSSRIYNSNKISNPSRSAEKISRNIRDDEPHKSKLNEAKNSNNSSDEATQDTQKEDKNDLHNLPLPKREPIGAYYNLDTDEPFDKERIHREMEEKLRLALAKEGKVYPPKKAEASHPVFANDGSFLELFKKMQAQQHTHTSAAAPTIMVPTVAAPVLASTSNAAAYIAATSAGKAAPPPPIVGRRRGGKILKTGLVAKPKAQAEQSEDPKDFWSLYLAEVNKYKNHACESDSGNRPLVK